MYDTMPNRLIDRSIKLSGAMPGLSHVERAMRSVASVVGNAIQYEYDGDFVPITRAIGRGLSKLSRSSAVALHELGQIDIRNMSKAQLMRNVMILLFGAANTGLLAACATPDIPTPVPIASPVATRNVPTSFTPTPISLLPVPTTSIQSSSQEVANQAALEKIYSYIDLYCNNTGCIKDDSARLKRMIVLNNSSISVGQDYFTLDQDKFIIFVDAATNDDFAPNFFSQLAKVDIDASESKKYPILPPAQVLFGQQMILFGRNFANGFVYTSLENSLGSPVIFSNFDTSFALAVKNIMITKQNNPTLSIQQIITHLIQQRNEEEKKPIGQQLSLDRSKSQLAAIFFLQKVNKPLLTITQAHRDSGLFEILPDVPGKSKTEIFFAIEKTMSEIFDLYSPVDTLDKAEKFFQERLMEQIS